MKKLLTLMAALLLTVGIKADDRHITFGELPKNAKIFVLTYFKDVPFKEVVIERRASLAQYEIELANGFKLQFDRMGLCTEIDAKQGAVPDEVMPKKIVAVVAKYFPDCRVKKFENNGRMYEVDLDNGVTLTFSKTLRLVDIDEDEEQ